ncbi:hypothetical protein BDV18DRAFT_127977 [Aspergillus unguis]
MDNYKSRGDDLGGDSHSNSEARMAEGTHYDRNKAPALQDLDKERSEKVDVGAHSSSMVDNIRRGNPSGVA